MKTTENLTHIATERAMMNNIVQPKRQLYHLVDRNKDIKAEQSLLKDPEQKQYLVCYLKNSESDVMSDWEIYFGRRSTYDNIIEQMDNSDWEVDVYNSFVLTDGVRFEDRKTLYSFMKKAEDIFNDGFSIDDYVNSHYQQDHYEGEYQSSSGIDPSFVKQTHMELNMLSEDGNEFIPIAIEDDNPNER